MDTQRLALGLLVAALALMIMAAATPWWACGNLYTDCTRMSDKASILSIVILFTIGLVFLAIVLVLDFIKCCVTARDQLALNKVRMILLFLGVACLIIAVILYTVLIKGKEWSYFAAVVGSVFALQVVILTLMTCSCACTTTTHHRVPVA